MTVQGGSVWTSRAESPSPGPSFSSPTSESGDATTTVHVQRHSWDTARLMNVPDSRPAPWEQKCGVSWCPHSTLGRLQFSGKIADTCVSCVWTKRMSVNNENEKLTIPNTPRTGLRTEKDVLSSHTFTFCLLSKLHCFYCPNNFYENYNIHCSAKTASWSLNSDLTSGKERPSTPGSDTGAAYPPDKGARQHFLREDSRKCQSCRGPT